MNHPNIAAIYELDESNGTRFLVLELVGGETLVDRIARGPIPVEESLKIALQIAEALEAAHEHGIVHRDLKPANIKVTPEGKVKVLDFGLAKAFAGGARDATLSHSPTISIAATQHGVILGTAAYMSPEQARRQEADKRADIWSCGCVLYEMLTGRQTWTGPTATDLIAAALAKAPDFAILPVALHPRIPEVLSRCLEKDPIQRFRDIGDVRVELGRVLLDPTGIRAKSDQAPSAAPWARGRERLAWALFAVAVLGAAVVSPLSLLAPAARESPEWFSILPPNSTFGVAPEPAVSPDGRSIVFRARTAAGEITLWVRSFDSASARELPGTEQANLPFWSPDGRSSGFRARTRPCISPHHSSSGKPASRRTRNGWRMSSLVYRQTAAGLFSRSWTPLKAASTSGCKMSCAGHEVS